MSNKSYKIARRMIDISKWYQSPKLVPMWCLIECGQRLWVDFTPSSIDHEYYNYEDILIKSEDYDTIKKELDYFNGDTP